MRPLNGKNSTEWMEPALPELLLEGFLYRPLRRVTRAIANGHFSIRKIAAGLVAGAAVLAIPFLYTHKQADAVNYVASLYGSTGFTVSRLVVEGNYNVELADIEAKLQDQLGRSIFGFDVNHAQQAIMSSSWVKNASVRKVFPDTVAVDMVEYEPFALWKSSDKVYLISRDGNVLGDVRQHDKYLPQVVGNGANIAAAEFLAVMSKHPDLTARASAYVRVASRRWNIVLHDGPGILLPQDNWQKALHELEAFQKRQQVFERDILLIDMRLEDRVVIKMAPEVAATRRAEIQKALKRNWHRT